MRRASLDDLEQNSCQLAPTIQHRIIVVQNQDVSEYFTILSLVENFVFKLTNSQILIFQKFLFFLNSKFSQMLTIKKFYFFFFEIVIFLKFEIFLKF